MTERGDGTNAPDCQFKNQHELFHERFNTLRLRWINARHFQNTKVILEQEFHGKRLVRNSKADPALIPMLIDQGFSDREIASRMGWTVGTLRVVCSHLKISLRRSAKVLLPQAILDQLNCRAELMSVSSATLAADLLSVIARDNLFNAVLDTDDIVTYPKHL